MAAIVSGSSWPRWTRNCKRDSNSRAIIRDAVLHDRFELHYQPLFEMSERRLIGYEALIRLPAEDGTLIPPLVFIPVAEDLQLIDKIGAWVLREACRTAATWPEHLTVAVNLSPAQFLAGRVSDIVAAALKEAGLAAHRLELEITETLLLGNSEAIMAELQTLKAMGVAIVMDDFGTGYSSLSYLWRFPFDKIKIDRSFMQGFDGSGRDVKTVVKTIIALGRELNMRVTVEGVETATQAAFLDKADGDQAQGFFFGRPIPASEVSANILADFRRHMLAPSSATCRKANCTCSSHRRNCSAARMRANRRRLGGGLFSPGLHNHCVAHGLHRTGLQRVTHGFELLGVLIQLICSAILFGCKLMLLIGVFALFRGKLMCFLRQILLDSGRDQGNRQIFSKEIVPIFQERLFRSAFCSRSMVPIPFDVRRLGMRGIGRNT